MVDRYWRKINDVKNDIENSMQISSILLKLKGYDEKLGDLSKIENNENNISSNLGKININETNISSNLGKINTNQNNISSNLEKIDNIKEFLISPEDFKKTFNIEKQIFRFNGTTHFDTIFEKEILYDFTKNSLLSIDNNIHYKYENLSNNYFRLQHEYNIDDDKDNLIYKYFFNKDTYYDENQTPILLTIDDFCTYLKKL